MNNRNDNQSGSNQSLTPAGKARRHAMLDELQSEMQSIHQSRCVRQKVQSGLVVASLVVVAVSVSAVLMRSSAVDPPKPLVENRPTQTQPVEPARWSGSGISIVSNRPGISEKYLVSRQHPETQIELEPIDNQQLQDLLAESGHPSVVGWVGGKVRVVPLKEL